MEFFSVFLLHFTAFFPSIVRNCVLVFFLEPLSVFSLDLEAFCCRLMLLPNPCVLARLSVFPSFSVCPLRDPRADLFPAPSMSAPPSSGDSMAISTVALGTSNSLPNKIAVAVAQALQQSLPTFVVVFCVENLAAPLLSAALPSVSSVVSSLAMVAASSLSSVAGKLRLQPFMCIFRAISSTPGSCSARQAWSIAAPILVSQVTSFSSHGESLAASFDKAFVVGPGHAPIPGKLVKKIISGEFVELVDLLSTNLRAVNLEPQALLDGKLLVSKKHQLVEAEDILTWMGAFTIYQMVICASHPHRWSDLTKYKLLIIQTARHSPGRSWLEYDITFRKDAAATGASDWSRMNLDLHNLDLRSPAPPLSLPSSSGSPLPFTTTCGRSTHALYVLYLMEQRSVPLAFW